MLSVIPSHVSVFTDRTCVGVRRGVSVTDKTGGVNTRKIQIISLNQICSNTVSSPTYVSLELSCEDCSECNVDYTA